MQIPRPTSGYFSATTAAAPKRHNVISNRTRNYPTHNWRDLPAERSIDELPDQRDIGRVHQKEDGRVKGYRLRRELAYRRPGSRERKQRYRKQMREIEPQQAWRSLTRSRPRIAGYFDGARIL